MYLVITEKPSVARSIADMIGAQKRIVSSAGVLDILLNMWLRMPMTRNSADGTMRICPLFHRSGNWQCQRIRRISSMC